MMRWIVLAISVAGVFASSLPTSALALVPQPRALACMRYFKSDAVFIGKVLSSEDIEPKDENDDNDDGGYIYTIKIAKSYLGAWPGTVKVFTPKNSGAMYLDTGKSYLLFANLDSGQLTIGWDNISDELGKATQAVADLEKLTKQKPTQVGDIYARVVHFPFNDSSGGLEGIHVEVDGQGHKYVAVTNKAGWVHIRVPSGLYSATAHAAKATISDYDLVWDHPESFTVPDGGCSELIFVGQTSD